MASMQTCLHSNHVKQHFLQSNYGQDSTIHNSSPTLSSQYQTSRCEIRDLQIVGGLNVVYKLLTEACMLFECGLVMLLASMKPVVLLQWWLLMGLNVVFLVAGPTAAVILGRFYYDQGGSTTFMSTFVQTAGFSILFVPLLLLPPSPGSPTPSDTLSGKYVCLIYTALGVLLAVDNYLYSMGLLYLSASAYSLICATQLVSNAIFAFFINSQKFAQLILIVTLLGVYRDSDAPEGLTFVKALKKETFGVVLEMQIYTSIVASVASVAGLIVSGQLSSLLEEMDNFHAGKVSYVMTLVWTDVCWQVASVGVVGLIFLVPSLFSNVISTVALAVAPIASVIVFHDKMNDVKIIAMLLALFGFACYIYQNYIDESSTTQSRRQIEATTLELIRVKQLFN
ncbi:putative purine permease 11 [Silene latifolia]|uniref:putative purine permease 11 n=1 Tax=Silene latifolia TaxID=37657 RepID=UPI003D7810AE